MFEYLKNTGLGENEGNSEVGGTYHSVQLL